MNLIFSLIFVSNVEFIPLDLASCLKQVKSGEIDAVAGLFFSDERAEDLMFSEPVIQMKNVTSLLKRYKLISINTIVY